VDWRGYCKKILSPLPTSCPIELLSVEIYGYTGTECYLQVVLLLARLTKRRLPSRTYQRQIPVCSAATEDLCFLILQ